MRRITERMDIYIEESNHAILLQEKWQYNWLNEPNVSPWTYQEKLNFHTKADNLIWQIWGGKLNLKVIGQSDFARKHSNVNFKVKFDVKWVLMEGHWSVYVTKIPKGSFKSSNVNWSKKIINIDSEDIKLRSDIFQYPIAHEFGHCIGNSSHLPSMHGDEYIQGSDFLSDTKSIMNAGMEVRNRHIDYLITQLNLMIPATIFQVV